MTTTAVDASSLPSSSSTESTTVASLAEDDGHLKAQRAAVHDSFLAFRRAFEANPPDRSTTPWTLPPALEAALAAHEEDIIKVGPNSSVTGLADLDLNYHQELESLRTAASSPIVCNVPGALNYVPGSPGDADCLFDEEQTTASITTTKHHAFYPTSVTIMQGSSVEFIVGHGFSATHVPSADVCSPTADSAPHFDVVGPALGNAATADTLARTLQTIRFNVPGIYHFTSTPCPRVQQSDCDCQRGMRGKVTVVPQARGVFENAGSVQSQKHGGLDNYQNHVEPLQCWDLFENDELPECKQAYEDAIKTCGMGNNDQPGFIIERWDEIEGSGVNELTGDQRYPFKADNYECFDQFVDVAETHIKEGNNKGQRLRADFSPPRTGNYTFMVSGDDTVDLYMESTTRPLSADHPSRSANLERVAWVSERTLVREFDSYDLLDPGRKTNPRQAFTVELVKDRRYFLQAITKNGNGDDNQEIRLQSLDQCTREDKFTIKRCTDHMSIAVVLPSDNVQGIPLEPVPVVFEGDEGAGVRGGVLLYMPSTFTKDWVVEYEKPWSTPALQFGSVDGARAGSEHTGCMQGEKNTGLFDTLGNDALGTEAMTCPRDCQLKVLKVNQHCGPAATKCWGVLDKHKAHSKAFKQCSEQYELGTQGWRLSAKRNVALRLYLEAREDDYPECPAGDICPNVPPDGQTDRPFSLLERRKENPFYEPATCPGGNQGAQCVTYWRDLWKEYILDYAHYLATNTLVSSNCQQTVEGGVAVECQTDSKNTDLCCSRRELDHLCGLPDTEPLHINEIQKRDHFEHCLKKSHLLSAPQFEKRLGTRIRCENCAALLPGYDKEMCERHCDKKEESDGTGGSTFRPLCSTCDSGRLFRDDCLSNCRSVENRPDDNLNPGTDTSSKNGCKPWIEMDDMRTEVFSERLKYHSHGYKYRECYHTPVPTTFSTYGSDVPSAWSWNGNSACSNTVVDQGQCGAGYAFAVSSMLADRTCIQSAGVLETPFLSEQDIISCSHRGQECAGSHCNLGCDGGYLDTTAKHIIDDDILSTQADRCGKYDATEASTKTCGDIKAETTTGCYSGNPKPNVTGDKAFHAATGSCYYLPTQPVDYQKWAVPGAGEERLSEGCNLYDYDKPRDCRDAVYQNDPACMSKGCHTPEEIAKIELMTFGPIVSSLFVDEDFNRYQKGVYSCAEDSSLPTAGIHSVKIIGWGEENNASYWMVENSFGAAWGESGYVKIRRGGRSCGIESNMIVFDPYTGDGRTDYKSRIYYDDRERKNGRQGEPDLQPGYSLVDWDQPIACQSPEVWTDGFGEGGCLPEPKMSENCPEGHGFCPTTRVRRGLSEQLQSSGRFVDKHSNFGKDCILRVSGASDATEELFPVWTVSFEIQWPSRPKGALKQPLAYDVMTSLDNLAKNCYRAMGKWRNIAHISTQLKTDLKGIERGHDSYRGEFVPKLQTTANEIYDCLKQGEVHGTGQFTIVGQAGNTDIPRVASDEYKYGNMDYTETFTILPQSASCADDTLEVCKQDLTAAKSTSGAFDAVASSVHIVTLLVVCIQVFLYN
jgi:hypothetical protein